MRLNLGAGESELEGYDNSYDAKAGKRVYPLDLPDACADEVRASHILEHFSHGGARKVLSEWVRVAKPGGLVKLAVPDFERIAQAYVAGEPGQYQGWICGGQVDPLDSHLAIYDYDALAKLMRACGLVGIHRWQDGAGDCASLPISLNLAGWKMPNAWPSAHAALSVPRLGWNDTWGCIHDALSPLGIASFRRTGVYWGQCMTQAIEAVLETGAEWVLTVDYDSVFCLSDVEDMLAFAVERPDAAAIVPMQMWRDYNMLLMRPKEQDAGVWQMDLDRWMQESYIDIASGHFGLTLIRARSLKDLPKPWFARDGDLDDDMYFWRQLAAHGLKAYIVPRVVIGHLEVRVKWPDRQLNELLQTPAEYHLKGKPQKAWR